MAIIVGTSANDVLNGTTDDDTLTGLEGNDELFGDDGDDVLDGGEGGDIIDGGLGIDTVDYSNSAASVTIIQFAGIAFGGDADGDSLISIENIIGSEFGDTLLLDDNANVVDGGDGDDNLLTYGGDDTIYGGLGNDTISGGAGLDTVFGGAGVDVIFGDGQPVFVPELQQFRIDVFADNDGVGDLLYGEDDNDIIFAGAGDVVDGGTGTDLVGFILAGVASSVNLDFSLTDEQGAISILNGFVGASLTSIEGLITIIATTGDDTINTGNLNLGFFQSLSGLSTGAGNDTITSSGDFITIDSGDGNDVIDASGVTDFSFIFTGSGDDTVLGGAGDDLIDIAGSVQDLPVLAGTNFIDGGSGSDTLQYARDTGVPVLDDLTIDLKVSTQQDTGFGLLTVINVENITAGFGNDTLKGDDGANVLVGRGGDDTLNGRKGADILDGGDGNDALFGGRGSDTLFGMDGSDELRGGRGQDLLDGGFGNDLLMGGRGTDVLNGGDGADRLKGGKGADTLIGGFGDDSLTGGNGADVFLFDIGAGSDTIGDFEGGVDVVQFTGAFAEFEFSDLAISQLGGTAFVSLGGVSIAFLNTDSTTLDASDFLFG